MIIPQQEQVEAVAEVIPEENWEIISIPDNDIIIIEDSDNEDECDQHEKPQKLPYGCKPADESSSDDSADDDRWGL